jgi:hypothetical protein
MLPKRRFWKAEPTFQNAFPGEALFNDSAPKSSTHTLEKCFPWKRILKRWFDLPTSSFGRGKVHYLFSSVFWSCPNHCFCFHRLCLSTFSCNFMLPKRRFGKDEQKMKSRFSIYFSMVRSQNRVLTPLKGISKIWISSFVHLSQNFVWER